MKAGEFGALEEKDLMRLGRLDIVLAVRTLKRWAKGVDFGELYFIPNPPDTPLWNWVSAKKWWYDSKKGKTISLKQTVFTSEKEKTLGFTVPQDSNEFSRILLNVITDFFDENQIPTSALTVKKNMWDMPVYIIPTFEEIKRLNGFGVIINGDNGAKLLYPSPVEKEINLIKRVVSANDK